MLIICSALIYAGYPIIKFQGKDQVDIGHQGWFYDSAHQFNGEKNTVQPSLKTLGTLSLDKLNEQDRFSTYSKTIYIDPKWVGDKLVLYIPFQRSINQVIVNGKVVVQVNQTLPITASNEFWLAPKLIFFKVDQPSIKINIQVINNIIEKHEEGISYSLGQEVYLLPVKSALKKQVLDTSIHIFIEGFLLSLAIFITIFSYYRKKQDYYYFIGLLSIVVVGRSIILSLYAFNYIATLDWVLLGKLYYISGEIMVITYISFIKSLFKGYTSELIYYISFILLFFSMLILLFTPIWVGSRVFLIIATIIAVISIYFIYLIFTEIRKNKKPYPIVHSIGMFLIFITFIHEFLICTQILRTSDISLFVVCFYVFYVVYEMMKNSSKQTEHIEKLVKDIKVVNTDFDEKIFSRTQELIHLNKKLDKQSKTDMLTGIYNRGFLDKQLEQTYVHCLTHYEKFSLIMIDIDYFKKFNDYYGHLRGDQLIKTVVDIIRDIIPKDSFFGRYGGEEFVIILGNYSSVKTQEIANHICSRVEGQHIEHAGRPSPYVVTISIGAVSIYNVKKYQSAFDILQLADEQLYMAKMQGRNQVRLWSDL